MASFARAARFMVLLQIALFVVSMVITSSSVCLGAVQQDIGRGAFDPNRPAVCPRGRPCGRYPGGPYIPYPGRPYYPPYRGGAPPPNDRGIGRP
nr:protein WIR1B-like [Lolium perenne]